MRAKSGAGGWREDLDRWLQPFLAGLFHPTRRTMRPLYMAGLIGLGDCMSVQPMAARAEGIPYTNFYRSARMSPSGQSDGRDAPGLGDDSVPSVATGSRM